MTPTPAMQVALTATPLAAYFYALGVFHSGRHPRMVAGPVDVGLLAFGLGGLVAFGPFGKAVLGGLVGSEVSLFSWAIWVVVIGLWALVLAGSASLRLTVYHVDSRDLERAVREALGQLEGRFSPTLHGFEDATRGVGITLKPIRFLRTCGVEAYGREPEVLIRELKPVLGDVLSRLPQRASGVSHALFGMACLTMLVPVTGFLIANPRAKDALRMLMHSLRWW
jgi:hypothetical protein